MTVLEGPDYQNARDRIKGNPVIRMMAASVAAVPLAQIAHEDGTPRFAFMRQANRAFDDVEARNAGNPRYEPYPAGADRHLGLIAEAVLAQRAAVRKTVTSSRPYPVTPDRIPACPVGRAGDPRPEGDGMPLTSLPASAWSRSFSPLPPASAPAPLGPHSATGTGATPAACTRRGRPGAAPRPRAVAVPGGPTWIWADVIIGLEPATVTKSQMRQGLRRTGQAPPLCQTVVRHGTYESFEVKQGETGRSRL